MRFSLILSFLFFPIALFGQSVDSLKTEISQLEIKVKTFDQRINSLEQKRQNVKDEISKLRQLISKIELENEFENGIPTKVVANGKLKDKPAVYGNVIDQLKEGDKVLVRSMAKHPYFKVSHDSLIGYITSNYLEENEAIEKGLSKMKEDQLEKINKDDPKLARLIEKYGESTAYKLIRGEIWLGMTDVMAIDALGFPKEVNKSTGSWGVHEQWVYPDGKYLYFENGKLKSIQE